MSAMTLWMRGPVAHMKRALILGSASLPTGRSASSSQPMVGYGATPWRLEYMVSYCHGGSAHSRNLR